MGADSIDQVFIRTKEWLLSWLSGAPDWAIQIVSALINIFALLAVFLTLFALISVLERKILGRIQNRYGPNRVGPFGLFQPVADGIKMLIKEDIVPARADKVVHFIAPTAILTLGVIPYGRNMTPFAIDGGILFFFAIGSTTELAVFMAGWGSNNKFSMLGAMRAIAQMISYELPLIITVLPVVMVVGSLSPDAIVAAQDGYFFGIIPHWFVITPWGAAAFILFLGGWHAPAGVLQFLPSYFWFFTKLASLLLVYIWIRGTLPRTRVDQIMNFAWKFMLPMSFTCILSAAIWHYQGRGMAGWLWSLAVIAVVYLVLSRLLDTRKRFAPRTYRFAE